MNSISDKKEKNGNKRNPDGTFIKGEYEGGPGRPKMTEEEKAIRRAEKDIVKKYIQEYELGLAEALPEIQPALIQQAAKGNIAAIREIHEVVGAHKNKGGNVVVPVQINFNDAREEFE